MPTWDVELSRQQIYDVIQDAMGTYSQWRPRIIYGSVKLSSGRYTYLNDTDMGLGVVDVTFVDSVPAPTEIFYGNLISPAPLLRTGLDEYDSFLRWRKTWQRVMSVMPDWLWDDDRKQLYIHNPIERYHAAVVGHGLYAETKKLPHFGAQWVRDYSLAKARYLYGDILLKFSGAIPGPLQDIQLDQGKRAEGEKQIEKLLDTLKASQLSISMTID